MFFLKDQPAKVVMSLFLFHFLTSQMTMLVLLCIGFILFLASNIFLVENFILNLTMTLITCVPGYIYLQWKIINQRFFKNQLKKKMGYEWTQEIKAFFWKKLCVLWYLTISGLVIAFSGSIALMHKKVDFECGSAYDFMLIIPGLAVLYFLYRHITSQLRDLVKEDNNVVVTNN